jgi:DNA-directed RNA polymerase subunit alpha
MAQGVQAVPIDLKEIVLSNNTFGPNEIRQISRTIAEDYSRVSILRDAVAELEVREDLSPATAVRLGVCYYLLGKNERAVETLQKADGGALARFYLARAHHSLGRYDGAIANYEAAKKAGYDADQCILGIAESLRNVGRPQEALKMLDNMFGAVEQTAEYLYQRAATVSAVGGNPSEVVALYERAVLTNENHPGALFGLALENDRRGNDEDALDLYKRAVGCFPTHVGALLNLGLLYEDRLQYERAKQCYQRILDMYPAHERARLFMKDASASGDMYVDEEAQKRQDRLAQVLNIPVTDFELSVRSRNCLQKMGIRTLGDLTRTTELELLASKNFGETSLVEIREMLQQKGLQLGQFAHEKHEPEPTFDYSAMSPDEQALLERPIADLNLSVRARKCMARLGLNTLADLIRKTGDDLLECKNFGVTSLNEVREKLTQIGLKLRGD